MPEYALILLSLLIATVLLHVISKVRIYKSTSHLIATNLIVLMVASVWDNYAISRGHWSFNPLFLLGPKIFYMPIEEYGFIFICAYFGLVIYKILEKYLKY